VAETSPSTFTATEMTQIDRANASGKQPVVFVAEHGAPDSVSVMVLNSFPLLSVLCEKLPCLSSAVGTRK